MAIGKTAVRVPSKQATYDRVSSCLPKSHSDSGVSSNIRVVVRVSSGIELC